jgi:hypothetical protein
MTFAGQHPPAGRTDMPMFTSGRHLRWDDLRLDRGSQLFRLGETKSEVGQACLLSAFDACDLNLRRLPGLKLRHQLHAPHQVCHPLTPAP